jgi:phosphoenolpyruvate synthase/pyruvate phosphate dikinase
MNVKAYAEGFYKLTIRVGHLEEYLEKVERYRNGLRFSIYEGISLLSPRIVEESYQLALKTKEKLSRKKIQ